MERVFGVIWPSFLAAIVGEAGFFALINPQQLYFLGREVDFSPIATYSIGFIFFWALCACSSLLTCFLQKSAAAVNAEGRKG